MWNYLRGSRKRMPSTYGALDLLLFRSACCAAFLLLQSRRSSPAQQTGWNNTVGFLWQVKSTQTRTHSEHLLLESVWSDTEQTSSLSPVKRSAFTSCSKTSHFEVMWSSPGSSWCQVHCMFCLQCIFSSWSLNYSMSVKNEHSFSCGWVSCVLLRGTGGLPVHMEEAYRCSVIVWFYCSSTDTSLHFLCVCDHCSYFSLSVSLRHFLKEHTSLFLSHH